MPFVIYDQITGYIVKVARCPVSSLQANLDLVGVGFAAIESDADDSLQMVNIGTNPPSVIARPVMPLAYNGVSHVVGVDLHVESIPVGTVVSLPDQDITVTDGFIDWTSMVPGVYTLNFRLFPYQERQITAEFTLI